jgi:hypothetical protein
MSPPRRSGLPTDSTRCKPPPSRTTLRWAGINHKHQLEEKIEQDLWYKPRELRGWRHTMVERLAQAQQGLRNDQATDYDDSRVRGDVAFYQAAVARIDWRLKQLESRH